MSDLPRFENVDLTPTWDDVDPAELDFGGGALDPEPVVAALDADVEELNPRSLLPDVADTDTGLELPPEMAEDDVDIELSPSVSEPAEDEPPDEFAGLDDAGMQFADGTIGADTAPDDFDLA